MNRLSALRAVAIFATLAFLAAITGFHSRAAIAEAVFLIGASLAGILLFMSMMQRSPELKPIRIRVRR